MLRYYNFKDKNLLIGEISAIRIAEKYGTPIYVYDEGILEKKAELLRINIPPEVDIFYSVKANPNIHFIEFFKNKYFGSEVASMGELLVTLKANVKPQNIIFAGPGKSMDELEFAIKKGIYSINVESIQELEIINNIAQKFDKAANVGVRINPLYNIKGPKITMTGKSRPFGIDEDALKIFFKKVKNMQNINFKGIHVYIGTQSLNHEAFMDNLLQIVKLAIDVSQEYNVDIKMINFGGGIGVPYHKGDDEFDIVGLGKGFQKIIQKTSASLPNKKIRMIIEPGRYLMAESGVYLTKILYIKESRKKKYIVVDGGMNHFQQIGQVIKRNFPIGIINKIGEKKELKVNIAGRLCTAIDIVAENIDLPKASPGDIIGIYKTGAYGYSAAPLLFLSHPFPKEVLVRQKHDILIRGTDSILNRVRV